MCRLHSVLCKLRRALTALILPDSARLNSPSCVVEHRTRHRLTLFQFGCNVVVVECSAALKLHLMAIILLLLLLVPRNDNTNNINIGVSVPSVSWNFGRSVKVFATW